VETPQDNTKVDEPVKTDKEVIAEEEAAQAEEKKDAEKKPEEAKKPAEAKPKKPLVHVKDFEEDMVYLFQFTRSPQIPSISPFCLKLESWLKLQGIKYQNVDHKCKHRSKKGMLPFIELNGEEVADSEHIIEVLSKKFEKSMPAELSQEQKNVQHAMITMVENHLHWTIVHWKTKDVENILKGYKLNLQDVLGSKVPASVLNFYFKHSFCRKGLKRVRSSGMGALSAEDIENSGKKDLQTLSEMLGEKEFFFGEEPSMLDLVVFSHVGQLVMVDKEHACSLRDFLEADAKNLVGLVNRVKDRCWGDDWKMATEEMDLNPHIPKPEPPAPEPEKEEEKKEEVKEEAKDEADAEKKEEETKEEEKETKEEKKEEKEKVNMMTKLSQAFSKLKPSSSAAAPETETKKEDSEDKAESKEESKEEEKAEEKKEEENKEKESEEKKE